MKNRSLHGILSDLTACTDEKSVFVFTTTYAYGERNLYTEEYFDGARRVSAPTDLSGFERAVADDKVLAVCRFARPWMERTLAEHGIAVSGFQAFHFAGEHEAENDLPMNDVPQRLMAARDAMYLCTCDRDAGLYPVTEGKVSFLQFYRTGYNTPVDTSALEAMAPDEEVMRDFETAESFLYGAGLHFPTRRFFPRDITVRKEGLPIVDSRAVISVYPENHLAQVTVSLTLGPTRPQDFIYLHQIQCAPVCFDVGGQSLSIGQLSAQLLEQYGVDGSRPGAHAVLLELNRFGERSDSAELTDAECRILYGVLTGDEGWQHVPAELARARMDGSWTSRDFARSIAFADNFLLLNFNRGRAHTSYMASQRVFAEHYHGGLNDYFTMDGRVAGLNHGFYFSAETGMLVKSIADALLDRKPELGRPRFGLFLMDEIKRSKQYRQEMIRTLSQMERVNISELGELDTLVARALSVERRISSIEHLLELTESDLDLIYSTSTNRMVTLLTVVGLILALIQVLQGFVL